MLIWVAAVFAGLFVDVGAAPAQSGLPATLRNALRDVGVPAGTVGLLVYDLAARRPILEWNADRAMNPASAMKVLTTSVALEVLGPAYVWRTEVYIDGRVLGDVLEGDLILKGSGDPRLTLQDFWLLLRDLRARGLREIRGDLVLDRSLFALGPLDPGSFDNEPTRPYNVLPDALLINFKSIQLRFVPQEDGSSVRIFAEPDLPEIKVVNHLALGPGDCENWPEKPQAFAQPPQLVFAGVFPAGCGEKIKSFSLLSPNDYANALFRKLWQELGGSLTGVARDGATPPNARLATVWQSPPLADVIREINKWSNNVMARQLFLTLALSAAPPPATTEKATNVVQAWLARNNLVFPELVIENGAGLSRHERISSRHLAELLIKAWQSPLMPEFVSSLPLLGTDGTLRKRLPDSAAKGRAHLKTGYLEGVRALAGYLQDRAGRNLVVVSIVNHPAAVQAQPFQEAVVEWAYSRLGTGCCAR